MSTYEVEMMRGLVKDVSPLPRLRQNPEKAVTASYIENYRFNKSLAGSAEKLGGRLRLAASASPAMFANKLLGLYELRLSAANYLVACSTSEVKKIEYTTIGDPWQSTGTGLSDLTTTGTYTGTATKAYAIKITNAVSDPDEFQWSNDGGATYNGLDIGITGAAQALESGISITFAAINGHTLNDVWSFMVDPFWVASQINRVAAVGSYVPACSTGRRWSYAALNDLMIMSDFGVSALEKWSGAGGTAALGVTGLGVTTLKARYLATVGQFVFLGYTDEDASVFRSRVRWSDAGLPESWTSSYRADLGSNDDDIIMGISNLQNLAVVFKRRSVWVGGYVGDPDIYLFEKIVEGRGCYAPFSITAKDNMVYFVSNDGVYLFDGSSRPTKISGNRVSKLIMNNFTEEKGYSIWAKAHPSLPEIWFCSEDTPIAGTPTWIYNYQTDDWSLSTMQFNALTQTHRATSLTWDQVPAGITWDDVNRPWDTAFADPETEIFVGADNTNKYLYEIKDNIYYENTTATPITSLYGCNPIDCGTPNAFKRFSRMDLKFASSDMLKHHHFTIRIWQDSSLDPLILTVTKDLTIETEHVGAREYYVTPVYFNIVARSIIIQFINNNTTEAGIILGFDLYYTRRELEK